MGHRHPVCGDRDRHTTIGSDGRMLFLPRNTPRCAIYKCRLQDEHGHQSLQEAGRRRYRQEPAGYQALHGAVRFHRHAVRVQTGSPPRTKAGGSESCAGGWSHISPHPLPGVGCRGCRYPAQPSCLLCIHKTFASPPVGNLLPAQGLSISRGAPVQTIGAEAPRNL